jgi:hypothetical protein
MASAAPVTSSTAVTNELYVRMGRAFSFLVEYVEGSQADIGDFLFSKTDVMIVSGVAWRDIRRRANRRHGCDARQ